MPSRIGAIKYSRYTRTSSDSPAFGYSRMMRANEQGTLRCDPPVREAIRRRPRLRAARSDRACGPRALSRRELGYHAPVADLRRELSLRAAMTVFGGLPQWI